MASNYLHEVSDFKELLQVAAGEKKILPQLVEKDYWIMHCLYGLKEMGLNFELKGGTSLSKGYRIIHRFSEDIDIRIEPPADLGVSTNPNQTKPSHVESRREYYDYLAREIKIPGITKVERDHEFDDARFRSGGIRLAYESYFNDIQGLKSGILLEVGFDDTTPNEELDISSWAFEKGQEVGIPIIDNQAQKIKCYSPAYTFVEKLQTVSTKFRRQQESGSFPKNFLRHYYDIYCLLGDSRVLEFLMTDEYKARKEKRFPQKDNTCISENEAFLLSCPEVKDLYRAEYEKTRALYYQDFVPFETILGKISQEIDSL